VVKPLVQQIENEDGVMILENRIEEMAYADYNELICWYWDNTKEHRCLHLMIKIRKP